MHKTSATVLGVFHRSVRMSLFRASKLVCFSNCSFMASPSKAPECEAVRRDRGLFLKQTQCFHFKDGIHRSWNAGPRRQMRAADRAVYAAWTPDGGWDTGWKGVWLWSMSVVLAWQQDKAFLTSTVPGLLRSETPPPLGLSLPVHRGKHTIHKVKHNGRLSQSCMSVFSEIILEFWQHCY